MFWQNITPLKYFLIKFKVNVEIFKLRKLKKIQRETHVRVQFNETYKIVGDIVRVLL